MNLGYMWARKPLPSTLVAGFPEGLGLRVTGGSSNPAFDGYGLLSPSN